MILRSLACLALLAVTACGGGGSSEHEQLATDLRGLGEDLLGVLESVSDEASAVAAVGELWEITERRQVLLERAGELGESTPEEAERLEELSGAAEFGPRFAAEVTRLAEIPGVDEILRDSLQGTLDG